MRDCYIELNLSREMKLQHYHYSLQLKEEEEEKEEEGKVREQEVAQNFPKTLKIKFAGEHQNVLRVTTALHLGSRKIENEGAKEIREKHA